MMKTRNFTVFAIILLVMILSACKPPTQTPPAPSSPQAPTTVPPTEPPQPPTEAPTDVPPTKAPTTAPPTEITEPTPETPTEPPQKQRIEFLSGDDTQLVGTFFPGMDDNVPAIILMHQFGSDRGAWESNGLARWLQAPALAHDELWPQITSGASFAVFTFDFRGHGESGGNTNGERSDFLMDAKAALATVKELPGVDPERIALIGASIGADAAIDTCVQGCLGALSLSPGSYLDVPYPEVVTEMGLDNKPAWCLAAEDDPFSADTCNSAEGDSYRSIIYPQGGHGEALIKTGMDPDIGGVFSEFLSLVFTLAQ